MGSVDTAQHEFRERISFDDNGLTAELCGAGGERLKLIERELGVQIHVRGNELTVVGSDAAGPLAVSLLSQLYALLRRGRSLDAADIRRAAAMLRADSAADLGGVFFDSVIHTGGQAVRPKGLAQRQYLEAMRTHDIVFSVGPAGTGKTYLAMAAAVSALKRLAVKRIILTRPAVEAGERLGFLPGDLMEKVNPYLRPLYDALHDMVELSRVEQLLDRGQIEVAPLAFMRGRTLNNSFVILDEAQNTTHEQMLMFLTRLGYDAKAVITGDITQIDLPSGVQSGLVEALSILRGIEGIALHRFTEQDVVRHPLVQKIIRAYDRRPTQRGTADASAGTTE